MALCRYRLVSLDGDSVVLQVKRFGLFWRDVEDISNKEHKLVNEAKDLEKKIEEKEREWKKAQKERKKIVQEILTRKVFTNKDFGFSIPFVDQKMSSFQGRKPDIPEPERVSKPRIRVDSNGVPVKGRKGTTTTYSTIDKDIDKDFGIDITYRENQRNQSNKKGGNNNQQNNQHKN